MNKISRDEPLVFLLDLDQTIQGDVTPQLFEYNLVKYVNEKFKEKGIKKRIFQNKKDIVVDMKNGLLRPNFKRFIIKMKKRYPTCEFFVYTASERKWAEYLIPIIEETISVKFNKRIFTRDDCIYDVHLGRYMKSINLIEEDVKKSLKTKYRFDKKCKLRHIYLIDNSNVLYQNESHKLIKCESYNEKVVIDPLRNISKNVISEHYNILGELILKEKCANIIEFYKKHYTKLHNVNMLNESVNKVNQSDKFWLKILKKLKQSYKYI